MDPRNCFSLDIWMTLIRSDKRYRPARDEIAYEMSGVSSVITLDDFSAALRWADKACDVLAEKNGRNYDMRERFSLASDMINRDFDIDYDELLGVCDNLLTTYHPVPVHPDAPRVITQLSQRHPTMYASNTGMLPASRLRTILGNLNYPDLPGVFSDEVGASKPSSLFFDHVIEHFGDDSVILHVGDNPLADGIGAKNNGLWYVRVDDHHTVVDALASVVA